MRFLAAIFVYVNFAISAAWAMKLPDEPLAWSEEAPLITQQLEEGFRFEKANALPLSERHYCAAARLGSPEGQYRLARVYLKGEGSDYRPQWAANLLNIAAQSGHERAQQLLAGASVNLNDSFPACMLTTQVELPAIGTPLPQIASAPLLDQPISFEVVQNFIQTLSPEKKKHALAIQRLAPRFNVDARLALAVARVESNLNATARSPKNAIGLMQLIPATAERFNVRDIEDPIQNIQGGLAYLRLLLNYFNNDVALAVAAYNAGENAVIRYKGIPPYAETQEYVRRIMSYYRSPVHAAPSALPSVTPRVRLRLVQG